VSARHDGLVYAGTGPEPDAQAGTRTRTPAATRAGPADDGQPGTGTLDDATMVARARDGDVHAFEVLVRRYQRPIYRLAFRMLSDTGEAEDVTQETFVTAWRRLPEVRADAAFRGWLYRTAANRCLNILRARRPTAPLQEDAMLSANPAAGPEASAESHQRLAALRVALDRLTAEQRACWLLRETEGLSYAEIAEILHTSPQAVRGRLARARAELGEAMISWQ
jgi:RNA polymerase sigma-70 factor, ECF subfamily